MADNDNSPERYAVEFKDHCKVIKNFEDSELLSDIRDAFKNISTFPQHFIVKYEDMELDCFVDLDCPMDLRNRKSNKLKVLECDITKDSSGDEFEDPRDDSTEPINHEDQPTCSNSFTEADNWPYPFVIKDYMIRRSVLEKLSKNAFLSESDRSSIFMGLYDECIKYTKYPSESQYNDMISGLFRRFPSLSKECLTYQDTHHLWHDRLKSHFKRKRFHTRGDPEIELKRQKFGKRKNVSQDETLIPKKKQMCWGVANFLPDLEEGEDDGTYQFYQKEMAKQLKITVERRDQQKIASLMEKTFAHRRKLLITDLVRLGNLINLYPLICAEDQIMKEFHRITGWKIEERLKFSLQKYSNFIVANKSTSEKDLLEGLKIICSSTTSDDQRQYYMMCICLLSLPFHLRESPMSFFDFEEHSEQAHPRIYSESLTNPKDVDNIFQDEIKFSIKVENYTIAECSDFLRAILVWLASYYVFNIAYPKSQEATLIFIQKFFLNISDKAKVPTKVSKFIGVIKKGVHGL